MPELLMMKASQGLIPATDEAREWLNKRKLGATILVEARELRNPGLHRKFFALINYAFDAWAELVEPMEYKGQPVLPDRERFRKDVIISAGFYRAVTNLKNEIRIEHESIAWANMTEERFEKLYSAVIDVLLRRVFNGRICQRYSAEQLNQVVEEILSFA